MNEYKSNPTYLRLHHFRLSNENVNDILCVAGGFQEVGCGQNCRGGSPGEGQVLTHVLPFTIVVQTCKIFLSSGNISQVLT